MDNYLGEIRIFAGNFAPAGWQLCDGTLLSISQNDALFTLLGTTYGGDGINTFAVPDLRQRISVGTGLISPSGGSQTYVIGQQSGTQNVTLLVNNIPQHTHALMATSTAATTGDPANNMLAITNGDNNTGPTAYPDVNLYTTLPLPAGGTSTPNATLDERTLQTTGYTEPHDNSMPYVTINFIIATVGIYPS